MSGIINKWDREAEVVVIGSGGSGLTAAIVAHDHGAKVAVIERSDKVGGETILSGGMIWIPLNHHQGEIGISDSRDEAVAYVKRIAAGRMPDALIETYIDSGPKMVHHIEERTPVKFKPSLFPDYHSELYGGKPGGRTLEPELFNTKQLGDWAKKLRPAPTTLGAPMTLGELKGWNGFINPQNIPFDLIRQRMGQGLVGMGVALIAALLKGCLDRGIEIVLETRGRRLVIDDGRIRGLEGEQKGQRFSIKATKGVILACGGFEWNEDLKVRFLSGEFIRPLSPPFSEGDGLNMAMQARAKLACMSDAWWFPVIQVPGEEYEGRPMSRGGVYTRTLPHSIVVNRKGRRFTDEACNYNDLGKAFLTFDPVAYDYPNIPAWIIFDQNHKDKYSLEGMMPGDPAPDWVTRADTLTELARKVGIDPGGLEATVERFNKFAMEGVDGDFHRGENPHDRWHGDPDHKPNPNLGPVEKAPFYSLQIYLGALGTKGGPMVNTQGQVLSIFDEVIPGLYAAGNVMPPVTGPGYSGAGCSIGSGMTWGYIGGGHAAMQK